MVLDGQLDNVSSLQLYNISQCPPGFASSVMKTVYKIVVVGDSGYSFKDINHDVGLVRRVYWNNLLIAALLISTRRQSVPIS